MEEKLNELSLRNALIFGILVAASYYFFIFRPTDVKVQLEGLDQEIVVLTGEIAKKDRKIKEKQKAEQKLENLKEKLKKAKSFIPKEFPRDEAVNIVSNKARGVGLSIDSIGVNGEWESLNTVSFSSVNVSFKGSYEQLMYFLSDLTREDRVLSVSKMSIQAGQRTTGNDLGITGAIKVYKSKKQDVKKNNQQGGR